MTSVAVDRGTVASASPSRSSRAALDGFAAISPRLRLTFDRRATTRPAFDAVVDADLDAIVGGHLPTDPARTPSLRWMQALSAGVEGLVGPDAPRGRPTSP